MMLKPFRFPAFALAVSLMASPAMAETYKITHAGLRTLYLAPLFIAMDRGLFKARDLEVKYEEIDSGALSSAAVLSGAAQMTSDDLMGIAPLAMQGKEFMMVYNLLDRMTMDLVVRKEVIEKSGIDLNSDVKSRARILKGLTIGITRPAAPTDIYSRFLMQEAGLDPQRDATLVQIGGVPALSAAFRSGKIDAFMLSPPLPQMLERQGYGTIVVHNTGGELPSLTGITYIALFTSKEFAAKNPAAVKAYVQGIQEAVHWIKGNREEALKMLRTTWFKDTPEESLAIAFDRLLPALSDTGVFTEEGLLKVQRVYVSVGEKIDLDFKAGGFWTNDFVRQ
jgi:ABC-type nitrate/sulfonate/bicarbonate transport system substrate-binding protein